MKYRRLSVEEFENLREEFVLYLASQSIDSKDWQEIKEHDKLKMGALLDEFSDIVTHKALQNMECLKLASRLELYVFLFEEFEGRVIRIEIDEKSSLDLSVEADVADIIAGKISISENSVEVNRGNKQLSNNREKEMFGLIEKGATPCSKDLFLKLDSLIP